MTELSTIDGRRYIGDRERMIVHDTASVECERCLMEEVLDRGAAVGFEPDTLEQAFHEGFDYCDHCLVTR
jgi:hypothetical protein